MNRGRWRKTPDHRARLLQAQPEVVILDEVTAHLDSKSEAAVGALSLPETLPTRCDRKGGGPEDFPKQTPKPAGGHHDEQRGWSGAEALQRR